jgi:C4-dicarboxylate-specific signal transduction histidine kinase
VDLFTDAGVTAAGVGVRLGWCAAALALVPLMRRADAEARRRLHVALAAVNCAGVLALVVATGGSQGPVGPYTLALPLITVVAVRQHWGLAGVGALSGLAGGVGLPLLEGRPAREVSVALGLHLAVAVYAALAQVHARRLGRRLKREAEARERARAALEDSERRRLQAERLALLGQLTAGVAHEVGNPLAYAAVSLGLLEAALQRDGTLTPEAAEALGDARHGMDRIATLVRDLRAFSREQPVCLAPCALSELVDDALRVASVRFKRARPSVTAQLPAGLPRVSADADRIRRVLLNLVVNAADAVEPQGAAGSIRLTAEEAGGGRVRLLVEDSGPGLSPEQLARLFSPFFTTKGPAGTGLGLAVSYEYVSQCGGSLRGENRPDGPGARFILELRTAA